MELTHKQMSSRGGKVKSEAKREAARRNWELAVKALKNKRLSHPDSGQKLKSQKAAGNGRQTKIGKDTEL